MSKFVDSNRMDILIKKSKPTPTVVYETYWKFAAERQAIFFRRLTQLMPPWSNDYILANFKFTNAYRASDRVSQYLIRNVIYRGEWNDEDLLFRILLFKTFNKISTWELLERSVGEISWKSYSSNAYSQVLEDAMLLGKTIYSGAYILASGQSAFGSSKKYKNHLLLLEMMMNEGLAKCVHASISLESLFELLKGYPTLGKFLAFQYAIDINYSQLTEFDEMDFVVAGPGAVDGIRKCFSSLGDYTEADVIRWMADNQSHEFERLGLQFQSLWGRPLQLIDCQNLFCEVDKYARVAHPEIAGTSGRMRIKQKFSPSLDSIGYWFPPKWGINSQMGDVHIP